MKNSCVLVLNLSSPCTELARHLVLSGINIELVDLESMLIQQHHVETDFLFTDKDQG